MAGSGEGFPLAVRLATLGWTKGSGSIQQRRATFKSRDSLVWPNHGGVA